MDNSTESILRVLGRIEGRMDAFQNDLADHSRTSSASLAELKLEVTKRADDHAQRITSLEHSRTESKTAVKVIGAIVAAVGLSNIIIWIKSPWS